nr:FAM207A protein [Biomphalaria glabrata]
MGKVKRLRQKFHAASSKAKDKKKSDSQTVEDQEMIVESPTKPAPSVISNKDNLFKNVNIPALSLLAQKLPDFDARSSITSKTFRGQNLKKKDKMKIRQEVWLSKMDTLQTAKKKAKERKKKQQTPIVGDLSSMQDALPTLELLLKKTTGEASDRLEFKKPKPVQKEKARQKQMLDDIALFHKIVQHPLFKEDAVNTITEHLKHKIKSEQNEEENLNQEVDGKSSEPKSKKRKK